MEPSPGRAFLINYDLIEDKDYRRLIDELKRYGCEPRLKSAWILPNDRTANQTVEALKDHFVNFIDADDRLIVVRIDDYASYG